MALSLTRSVWAPGRPRFRTNLSPWVSGNTDRYFIPSLSASIRKVLLVKKVLALPLPIPRWFLIKDDSVFYEGKNGLSLFKYQKWTAPIFSICKVLWPQSVFNSHTKLHFKISLRHLQHELVGHLSLVANRPAGQYSILILKRPV